MLAQFAANDVAARRLVELADRYGADTLAACFERLHAESEQQMRAAIAALPDGVWEGEDHLDDDGVDDRPIRVAVRVEIRGDQATFDFAGTALQARGPVNTTYFIACSAVYYAMKALVAPDVPPNDGCYRPLRGDRPARHRAERGPGPAGGGRQPRDLAARRRCHLPRARPRAGRPHRGGRPHHRRAHDLRVAPAGRPLGNLLRGARRGRGGDPRRRRLFGHARAHVERDEHAGRGDRARVPDRGRGAGASRRLGRRRAPPRRPRPAPGLPGHRGRDQPHHHAGAAGDPALGHRGRRRWPAVPRDAQSGAARPGPARQGDGAPLRRRPRAHRDLGGGGFGPPAERPAEAREADRREGYAR